MLFGGKRMCDKRRLSKSPVVPERRNDVAHFGNSRHLDAGADDPDIFAGVGEHLAPRIDDQRMTIAASPGSVLTRLRGRKDKTAVLDRSRAQ